MALTTLERSLAEAEGRAASRRTLYNAALSALAVSPSATWEDVARTRLLMAAEGAEQQDEYTLCALMTACARKRRPELALPLFYAVVAGDRGEELRLLSPEARGSAAPARASAVRPNHHAAAALITALGVGGLGREALAAFESLYRGSEPDGDGRGAAAAPPSAAVYAALIRALRALPDEAEQVFARMTQRERLLPTEAVLVNLEAAMEAAGRTERAMQLRNLRESLRLLAGRARGVTKQQIVEEYI